MGQAQAGAAEPGPRGDIGEHAPRRRAAEVGAAAQEPSGAEQPEGEGDRAEVPSEAPDQAAEGLVRASEPQDVEVALAAQRVLDQLEPHQRVTPVHRAFGDGQAKRGAPDRLARHLDPVVLEDVPAPDGGSLHGEEVLLVDGPSRLRREAARARLLGELEPHAPGPHARVELPHRGEMVCLVGDDADGHAAYAPVRRGPPRASRARASGACRVQSRRGGRPASGQEPR